LYKTKNCIVIHARVQKNILDTSPQKNIGKNFQCFYSILCNLLFTKIAFI